MVSRDGNYLLNIGPRGDGVVTTGSVNALTGMGAWMSTYSDSIYGTTGSPFTSEPSWGYYTKKLGKLFAHVFSWPSNRQLVIGSLTNTINRVYLLNNPATSLPYTRSSSGITVSLPAAAPNADVSVVVVEVAGDPTAGPPSGGGATFQAEQGMLGGGASVDSNHAGFTGTGFVNFPVDGGSLQFNGVDGGAGGSRTLTIRFANGSGSGRTGRLVVNGVGQNITTPATSFVDHLAGDDGDCSLERRCRQHDPVRDHGSGPRQHRPHRRRRIVPSARGEGVGQSRALTSRNRRGPTTRT